jgi:hypothetical protein
MGSAAEAGDLAFGGEVQVESQVRSHIDLFQRHMLSHADRIAITALLAARCDLLHRPSQQAQAVVVVILH